MMPSSSSSCCLHFHHHSLSSSSLLSSSYSWTVIRVNLVTALKIEVMKTKMKNSGLSKNGSVQGYISNLIVQLMFLTSGFFVVTCFYTCTSKGHTQWIWKKKGTLLYKGVILFWQYLYLRLRSNRLLNF